MPTWTGCPRTGRPGSRVQLEFPTSQYKVVDLLYEPRFCGRIRVERMVDRGDTLEVQLLQDLEGLSVHRWGVHRLAAIILWRSVTRGTRIRDAAPGGLRLFPGIKLRLPAFLPDLGFDDLRDFDLPSPIFSYEWFNRMETDGPEWIAVHRGGTMSPWNALGPRPAFLDQLCPDL